MAVSQERGKGATGLPLAIALIAGAILWFAASLLTGRREPWDASVYWVALYPLALGACGLLGYAFPYRAWLWALALFEGQFLGMIVRNGELGGLWPLGMVLFAIIALPGVAVAAWGARLGRKRTSLETTHE
jgi:hypothetical protein